MVYSYIPESYIVATSRGDGIEKAKEDLEIAVSCRVKQMIQEKMQHLIR